MEIKRKHRKKKEDYVKRIRNIVLILIAVLVMLKINKTIFFIVVFSVLAYLGKQIRGMFGLKLIVLDPLHFSAIMMAHYIGIKEAVFFVALNTLIVDFATQIASEGTFANFFLYSGTAAISVILLSGTNPVIFCTAASLMYATGYYFFRILVPTQPQYEIISKCITNVLFTFLYSSFFGPLIKLLMTGI